MKILHVLDYAPAFGGGIADHLTALGRALHARGDSLIVALPELPPWVREFDGVVAVYELRSIRQPIRSGFRTDLARLCHEQHVDLVHLHFSFALPLALSLDARRWGWPTVYHWHNPPKALLPTPPGREAHAETGARGPTGGVRGLASGLLARWADRRVIARHVVVSAALGDLLVGGRWTARERVLVLPNGVRPRGRRAGEAARIDAATPIDTATSTNTDTPISKAKTLNPAAPTNADTPINTAAPTNTDTSINTAASTNTDTSIKSDTPVNIDTPTCAAAPNNPTATISAPTARPLRLGSVANFRPQKDHATLLRAFALFAATEPDATLDLVGDGPTRASMETLAASLGVAGRVRFLGAVPNDALDYSTFDLCVLATRYEGHPLTLLEAMASGVAVVATAVAGVDAVVTHGREGLLVPPEDPEKLAEALRRLALDPEARRRMGAAGRRRTTEEFGVDRWVEGLVRLYEELLAPERPR